MTATGFEVFINDPVTSAISSVTGLCVAKPARHHRIEINILAYLVTKNSIEMQGHDIEITD